MRLVKGGQSAAVTAKVLGIPNQTLDNWVRLSNKGQFKGAGDKPVSPEQMELARLRAELSRVKMERDILKNKKIWPVTLTREVLEVSASGYFEHWRRKDTPKSSRPGVKKRISNEALLVHIRAIHARSGQVTSLTSPPTKAGCI